MPAIASVEAVKELDALRAEVAAALQLARAENNQAAIDQARSLLSMIDDETDDAVAGIFEGFAADLADMRSRLEDITRKVKGWPFAEDEGHEVQFRAKLADNDFEDKGPKSKNVTAGAAPEDVVPVVAKGWSDAYIDLWNTMVIRPEWYDKAIALAKKIVAGQSKYAAAVQGMNVPWWFVGVVHAMECGLKFGTHLHNGDSLVRRTVRVPKGRPPVVESFPIDWVYSARDAIAYERLTGVKDWSLPSVLFHWHRFNGIQNNYKELGIPTPYLWSASKHYVKGKYVQDGVFDPNAVSKQVGAAVLLKALIDLGAVTLDAKQVVVGNPAAATQDVSSLVVDASGAAFKHIAAELDYPGPLHTGSPKDISVRRIQEWLYLHGFVTPIDSDFGNSTAEQLEKFATANGRVAAGTLSEELWALLTAPLRKAMAPLSPAETLEDTIVKVAQQHIDQMPSEIGGNNKGPWVRAYMRGKEGASQKWCAGFVCLVVEQAARDLQTKMPFKRKVGVDDLVKDAQAENRFIGETELSTPLLRKSKARPGRLFVVRESPTDWTHVGIVLSPMADTFDTLEGNTGGDGGTDGPNARRGNRSYLNKDFLRIL
ncbi:hypothetical protein [Rhizobium laguerreae]|uniref:hypothetical protein n=1 Tax=Rhizobium laguerreae TaxID=1076926 RepID=UPI001441121D|nr:hypothetical protein [Rhizobium laguerreae]NKM69393.1 hypothetical protein [Rhizobium laguerreae]